MSLGCHSSDTLDAITAGEEESRLGDGILVATSFVSMMFASGEKRSGQESLDGFKCQNDIKYSCRDLSDEVLKQPGQPSNCHQEPS